MDKENTQNLGQTINAPEGQNNTRTGSSNTAEKTNKVIQSKRRHVSFKQDTSKSLNNGKSVDKLLLIPKQIISNQSNLSFLIEVCLNHNYRNQQYKKTSTFSHIIEKIY